MVLATLNGEALSFGDEEDDVGLIDVSAEIRSRRAKNAKEAEEKAKAEAAAAEEAAKKPLNPQEVAESIAEADLAMQEGKYSEALFKYEIAYKTDSSVPKVVNGLARLYIIKGRLKDMVEVAVGWMKHLEETDKLELAEATAEAIMRFDLGSLEARLGVLRCLQKIGDEDEYIKTVQEYASYFIDVGDGEHSVRALQVALDAYPARMELAVKLVDVHMQLGNMQECIKQCRSIASFYENRSEYVKAAELYRRLRMLVPDDIDVALRLAQIYFLLERYDDSVSEYRNCMHIVYDNREALYGLAQGLQKTEKYDEAAMALRKILVTNHDDSEARELLGDIYFANSNRSEAITELSKVATDYVKFKEYDNAVRVLSHLLELDPDNSFAVREMANVRDLKERDEARLANMAKQASEANRLGRQKEAEPAKVGTEEIVVETAVSEDDLYADAGPVGGFDGGLGDSDIHFDDISGGLDDDFLPLMEGMNFDGKVSKPVEASNESASGKSAETKGSEFTRVIVPNSVKGKLQVPVPFVLASYPDNVHLMQQIITAPPDREVLPWETLAKLDADAVAEEIEAEAEADEGLQAGVATSPVKAGPVASAFGGQTTSVFGASAFSQVNVRAARNSNNKRRKRRSRWEDEDEEENASRGGYNVQEALTARFGRK